jgi:hypothetical protein
MFSVVLFPTLPQELLIICKSTTVEITRTSANGTAHEKGASLPAPSKKSSLVDKVQIGVAHQSLTTNH